MTGQQTVAVLGAGGTMGFPMAANLARAGFPVRAWNRSRDKAEPLAKDGVQVCGSPAEAADGADVILTMLADTDAVLTAVDGPDGAFAAVPAGAGSGPVDADGVLWLQMSTIGEAGTERCAPPSPGATTCAHRPSSGSGPSSRSSPAASGSRRPSASAGLAPSTP